MMKRALDRLGVDGSQWAALARASIRKDFRQSSMSTTLRHGRSGGRIFFTLFFFYLLTGLIFVPIVLANPDVVFTTTMLISYTMFMIGGLILVEYHTVVVSPDDFHIFGYLPVSSQTYFLVKLTNILFYVLAFSLVLALPAIVTYFFTLGFKPLLGISAFFAVFLANLATAMGIVLVYTFLLTRVSMRRLQNVLAFFQVGLAFVVYSSVFFIPKILAESGAELRAVADSSWFALLPSAWFSKYVPIALGRATVTDWLLALLSVLAIVALGYLAMSKLSLDYSKRLTLISAAAPIAKKHIYKGLINPLMVFRQSHEDRVVSKLIRNQFLFDNKFKMAVLGILPLTIFYLFVGVEEGPLPDPFTIYSFDIGRTGLLYLLVFLFPMMLRTYVTQSDAYEASWIFYATPTDVQRLILSEKNFLMIYFVLPFLTVLGIIFYFYFQNLLHVLLHVFVLGLLAHLFLQFAFLYSPDLPFSRPNVKGRRSRNLLLFIITIPFVIYLVLPLIFRYVYPNPPSFVVFSVTILAVSWLLENLVQVRISHHLKKCEFAG